MNCLCMNALCIMCMPSNSQLCKENTHFFCRGMVYPAVADVCCKLIWRHKKYSTKPVFILAASDRIRAPGGTGEFLMLPLFLFACFAFHPNMPPFSLVIGAADAVVLQDNAGDGNSHRATNWKCFLCLVHTRPRNCTSWQEQHVQWQCGPGK